MTFKKVDPKQSFPKMEEEVLKFWQENNIFKKSIENRDYIDSNRKITPLKKADDAVEIDTSDMSIDEVVNKVINMVGEKDVI